MPGGAWRLLIGSGQYVNRNQQRAAYRAVICATPKHLPSLSPDPIEWQNPGALLYHQKLQKHLFDRQSPVPARLYMGGSYAHADRSGQAEYIFRLQDRF